MNERITDFDIILNLHEPEVGIESEKGDCLGVYYNDEIVAHIFLSNIMFGVEKANIPKAVKHFKKIPKFAPFDKSLIIKAIKLQLRDNSDVDNLLIDLVSNTIQHECLHFAIRSKNSEPDWQVSDVYIISKSQIQKILVGEDMMVVKLQRKKWDLEMLNIYNDSYEERRNRLNIDLSQFLGEEVI